MTYADWLEQRKLERAATAAAQQASSVAVNVIEQIFSESDSEIVAEHDDSLKESSSRAEPQGGEAEGPAFVSPESSLKSVASSPTFLPALEHFTAGSPFRIGDLDITPFSTPHDAADPCGFVSMPKASASASPQTSATFPRTSSRLSSASMSSCWSPTTTLRCSATVPTPGRSSSASCPAFGHLSNVTAAEFLADDYDGHAAYVLLAHISESNNLPELARISAEQALAARRNLLGNRLLLARQHEPLPTIAL